MDAAADDGLAEEFAELAAAMPVAVRQIIVDNVPPEDVPLQILLDALGLKEHYPEHSYTELRSLRLLRLAQGLLPEPPLVRASGCDVLQQPGAVSNSACARLRELVDDDARRSAVADSVDGAPDHQVDLKPNELEALLGDEEALHLYGLMEEFRRRSGSGAVDSKVHDDQPDGVQTFAQSLSSPSEIFVRRYSSSTRPWISFHCDRAAHTINVALAGDSQHSGGKLVAVFDGKAQSIVRQEGDATVHSSSLCHGVTRMLSGTRYSLILFFERRQHGG